MRGSSATPSSLTPPWSIILRPSDAVADQTELVQQPGQIDLVVEVDHGLGDVLGHLMLLEDTVEASSAATAASASW